MKLRAENARAIGWAVALGLAVLLASAARTSAQVPCSGNAGGLNERRYTVTPLDIATGPASVTANAFQLGGVTITQQVQVIVELMQETHFIALCLHADNLGASSGRAIPAGDLMWRRVSPDPMSDFVPVSRNTPAPIIAQQAVGTLVAVYEFRMRLNWATNPPGTYSSGLFWTAYRNRPN